MNPQPVEKTVDNGFVGSGQPARRPQHIGTDPLPPPDPGDRKNRPVDDSL